MPDRINIESMKMSIHNNLQNLSRAAESSLAISAFDECSPWHALQVRPRWEKVVATAVHGKEYEVFVPLYRKCSQWSDRVKQIDLPLFPGYVFCRWNLSARSRLVTTPGVLGILNFGGIPAVISHSEIDAIKSALDAGLCTEPWPYIHEGQRVRVHSGALTGVEGILIRTKNECRVILSVEALCRSVAVEVRREAVTPIP